MIKRLTHSSVHEPRHAEWPVDDRDSGKHLYEGRLPYRRIVVMIDADLMDESVDLVSPMQSGLMAGLLRHELVSAYRYDESRPLLDQPTDDESAIPRNRRDRDLPWVTVGHRDDGFWPVRYVPEPNTLVHTGVWGNAVDVARADAKAGAYDDFDADTAANRRGADTLAIQVASQALRADIFVSERPYLDELLQSTAHGTTVCGVVDALAILGLYFRSQGRFPVTGELDFNRGLFYWVGARELLPEAWRLVAGTSQSEVEAGYGRLLALAHSTIQRVARALETRDALHLAINSPQNNDTLDIALSSLDIVLSLLMGALDSLARIAHEILHLDGSERQAAWQRKDWVADVKLAAPGLAEVVSSGSDHKSALTILNLLRNSVHGEALRGVTFVKQSSPQSLVTLPSGDQDEVIQAMNALGGLNRWGIEATASDEILVDPGILVDRLFPRVNALLNDLMSRIPVERLPNVALTPADVEPPASSTTGSLDAFDPRFRQSIRWQLGF